MKKINSINYGGKILFIGIIFGILIPIIFAGLSYVLHSSGLLVIMKVSFVFGMLILFCFFVHLGIELHQDKKIERYYSVHGKRKIFIADGKYECGTCGNCQVQKKDSYCKVCGVVFEMDSDKTPQEILEKR